MLSKWRLRSVLKDILRFAIGGWSVILYLGVETDCATVKEKLTLLRMPAKRVGFYEV